MSAHISLTKLLNDVDEATARLRLLANLQVKNKDQVGATETRSLIARMTHNATQLKVHGKDLITRPVVRQNRPEYRQGASVR